MTLFELAYACRLFGKDDPYDILRKALGQNPDLASDGHQQSLLEFLNKWGCRIKEDCFPSLKKTFRNGGLRTFRCCPEPIGTFVPSLPMSVSRSENHMTHCRA